MTTKQRRTGKTTTQMQHVLRRVLRGAAKIEKTWEEKRLLLYIQRVTPEMAQGLIDHCNVRNRRRRGKKTMEFAKVMERGGWRLQNVILVSEDGELIDGQHRILAVIDSGKSQNFLIQVVPRGEEAVANLGADAGTPRNLGDFLHFRHVPNAYRVAPVLVYERNERVNGDPLQAAPGDKLTYLATYEDLGEDIFKQGFDLVGRGLDEQLGVRKAFLDWIAMRLCQIDQCEAAIFFELLTDGSQQKPTDPTFILREKLIAMARRKAQGKLKVSLVQQAHMIAKTWRLYAEKKSKVKPAEISFRPREDWPGIAGEEGMKEDSDG